MKKLPKKVMLKMPPARDMSDVPGSVAAGIYCRETSMLNQTIGSDDMELQCKHCGGGYVLEDGYDDKYCCKECHDADKETKPRTGAKIFSINNKIKKP